MINEATIAKIAHLSRLALSAEEAKIYAGELSAILDMVAELNQVDLTGVEPLTSVADMNQRLRQDMVKMPNNADEILKNGPETILLDDYGFFVVPKVVG